MPTFGSTTSTGLIKAWHIARLPRCTLPEPRVVAAFRSRLFSSFHGLDIGANHTSIYEGERNMHVAIAGGGIGGMTLALALLDAGIEDVDIYESALTDPLCQ